MLTPDVHLRHALDGHWTSASASTEGLLGYAAEELVGRAAIELVHPDDRPHLARALRAVLRVSDTLSLRVRLVRRDGSAVLADVRFDAVRDEYGAVTEHLVTLHDANDRRRSDELRTQWELLFRATRRGICVTDPRTGLIAAVNPAYAAMHGGEVEDFVGVPLSCVLAPAAAERIGDLGARHRHRGVPQLRVRARADGRHHVPRRDRDDGRARRRRRAAVLARLGRGPHRAPPHRARRDPAGRRHDALERGPRPLRGCGLARPALAAARDRRLRAPARAARDRPPRAGRARAGRAHRGGRAPHDPAARRGPGVLARGGRHRADARHRVPRGRRRGPHLPADDLDSASASSTSGRCRRCARIPPSSRSCSRI